VRTDFVSNERVQYESERSEQVYDENAEDNDENDVIVDVKDELPVRPITVQLLVDLVLLLLLLLMRRTHLSLLHYTCNSKNL